MHWIGELGGRHERRELQSIVEDDGGEAER